ncbi:hypothetical protein R6Q59_013369 [Mikania micrantha]
MQKVREMPVIGGTALFRFARGNKANINIAHKTASGATTNWFWTSSWLYASWLWLFGFIIIWWTGAFGLSQL